MEYFVINTEDRKTSIKELCTSIDDGDIILDPEYQRNFVYDIKKASKVIESIFLEIPLPAIFTNEEEDGTMEVIDGVQRLTSIIKFIKNEYELTGLELLEELNNKKFKDLTTEEKRIFRQKTLRVITFKKNSSDDLKFEIFLRLNQGSVKLNNQELRNCLYRGYFNNKIKEASNNKIVKTLLKFNENKINRFAIEEYVLRGLVFLNYDLLTSKKGLNHNMNNLMNLFKNNVEVVDNMLKEYLETLSAINTILGENAFNFLISENGKFTSYYHDSFLLLFKGLQKGSLMTNKDDIKKIIIESLQEDEFTSHTGSSTSNYNYVKARAEYLLNKITPYIVTLDKKRLFDSKDKIKMFNQSNICAICNNTIENIEDANIDHVIPWSKGGKTVLENAQLTHEFCNKSKGNEIF